MTAIVLPDIDRSTLAELRERMPSLKLSEIELPSMERAGRDADRAVDRLLGRSRPTLWPWFVLGIALFAAASATVWFRSWSRQPAWADRPVGGNDLDAVDRVPMTGTTTEDTYDMEGGRP